ncbi:MAG TPA: hypothetical protein VKB79_21910 [Bryobacteraceae bacterium]|nr:hypothetical protein [Bryobacteraceae bacterium]
MTRRTAIGETAALAATAISSLRAQGSVEQEFFLRLLNSSNETVPRLLDGFGASIRGLGRGENLAALAAAYCAPESSYYQNATLVPAMEREASRFVTAQHSDGTIDAGNLSSPPDTAFVVEGLATVLAVLRGARDARLATTEATLRKFLLLAGEALVTGGVHTPNHRWVVCSALARIHSLFPSAKYVHRIDDWLGEGVYQDPDGQFEERSTGIYSRVTDNALVTIARLLNRPRLLEPVRRNLEMTLYYLHPDGELESVASRRQDYNASLSISNYYLQYRYMAVRDGNARFAAAARLVERLPGERLVENVNPVIFFLEEPMLRRPLPAGGEIPEDYARVFAGSGLARVRRGEVSATVFGGSDWPLGVASGLSSNPTFFTFRKGKAVLHSVRMGAQFFGEGAFHAEGLLAAGDGYALHQRYEVPYYQPLPARLRNARGDYRLTPARDARFWSKLDFPNRPMSNVQTLDQKVEIVEERGAFELRFDISGAERVPFVIELAFRSGGEFQGQFEEAGTGANRILFLKDGMGKYRLGEDAIEFGPGVAEHRFVNLSGPSYAAHGATLAAGGDCAYIAGFTPFRRVVTVRAL